MPRPKKNDPFAAEQLDVVMLPDESTEFSHALIRSWIDADPTGHRPSAAGTRFRYSGVGDCARRMSYDALDVINATVVKSERAPMSDQGRWITGLGTKIHDLWQEAMLEKYGAAYIEFEVPSLLNGKDGKPLISGHADAILLESSIKGPDGQNISRDLIKNTLELKTANVYKYIKHIRYAGPDPRSILQGAINAYANDAQRVTIVNIPRGDVFETDLNRYNLDPIYALGAQWTFDREFWLPLAQKELQRVEAINDRIKANTLARRITFEGEELDPERSKACGLCPWRARCVVDGPGTPKITQG